MSEEVTKDMIGCLCWFNNYREIVVGILREIQTSPHGDTCYLDDNGYFYPECRPVKPDEVKFYRAVSDLSKEDKELKTRTLNSISYVNQVVTDCKCGDEQ